MIKNYSTVVSKIRETLKTYLLENKLQSLVLGVSGGIDSALVAALAKPVCDELNIPLIGRSLSIETNKSDEIMRSKAVGKSFCTDFDEYSLSIIYNTMKHLDNLDDSVVSDSDTNFHNIKFGNIKARLRMIYLYNLAYKTKGMVLGTENLTEENLAFFTIGGDEMSDFECIKDLWKTEVYGVAEWLCNNELVGDAKDALYNCITCNATDGLGISNSDLDQILPGWVGSSRDGYKVVDEIFIEYFDLIKKSDLSEDEVDTINKLKETPVIQRYNRVSYKRNRPFVIKRKNFEDIVYPF